MQIMQKSNFTYQYKLLLERLKIARLNSGLTQVQAAHKLGTTQSFVSKVESGERKIDLIELLQLADLYKLDAVKLIDSIEKGRRS